MIDISLRPRSGRASHARKKTRETKSLATRIASPPTVQSKLRLSVCRRSHRRSEEMRPLPYMRKNNANLYVIPMIETIEGLEHVDEICAIEPVKALVFAS